MGLTDLMIRKLAPKNKRYEVSDGKGLAIRVMPTGAKSWIFRYNFEGVPRRMTLGGYPGVTLAQAREKHGAAMIDIQNGIDPGQQLQLAKAKRKAAPTFKDLLDEYWELELGKTPTGKERRRLVTKDAIPVWGKRKVVDITRRDAVLLLDNVRKRAPITANRLQGVLVRMFYFASERGIIEHSPLTGMRRQKEEPRSRVLSNDEINKLWTALDLENKDIDIYRVTKLALKMILLTGQRPGEIAGMKWSEIDDDNNTWTIPANRRKNSETQLVPLCNMALDVIEQARAYSSDGDHVFRSSHKPDKPISRQAMAKAINRHWSEMEIEEAFTPHDLRRTLRTRLTEIGVKDIVAEKVLGHKLQGIIAVYNQYSYDSEKRQALIRWEHRLSELLGNQKTSNKVIQFGKRKE
jgi:integrase